MSNKSIDDYPKWATCDFFTKILHNYLPGNKSHKLLSYSVKTSQSAGQNYASEMFFGEVEYSEMSGSVQGQLLSIIIKVGEFHNVLKNQFVM